MKESKKTIRYRLTKLRAKAEKNITGQKWINQELYASGITLKNLAIVKKENPLSAEYIFEALTNNSNYLRPVYQEMLGLYRSGRDEEAFMVFSEKTGTKAGQHFSMILSKLDKINPSELIDQMDVFLKMMEEIRMTEKMKEIERKSILGTLISTLVIFALLINFTVVVVFLGMIDELNNLF